MKLPEFNFAFEKKLGVHEVVYGNIATITDAIQRLFVYMKETNKSHGVECEFFRLDFRQPYFDEQLQFPLGCFMLDLKWGSKDELGKKKNENNVLHAFECKCQECLDKWNGLI